MSEASPFTPQEDWTLISQGAEARVWKIPRYRYPSTTTSDTVDGTSSSTEQIVVAKERFSKAYRHPVLDERLTKQRCRAEARILEKCQIKAKLDVPSVIRMEAPVLYLEWIEGITVRDFIESMLSEETDSSRKACKYKTLLSVAKQIGTIIGTLHSFGMVHGDLTTSNMMVRRDSDNCTTDLPNKSHTERTGIRLVLIDFGLSKNTESAEERAVDLYVLERALTSTHPSLPEGFYEETLLSSYAETAGTKHEATLTRLEQVRQRGRKRECFG
jgi:TP53 regulating kinase-like protein